MNWSPEQQETIDDLHRYIEKEDQVVQVNSSFKLAIEEIKNPLLKSLIQFLMVDDPHSFRNLAKKHPSDTLFGEQKYHFLSEVREYFKNIFNELVPFLNAHPQDHLWGEIFIGHLLAYFTFLSPEEGELIRVPILEQNHWNLVDYKIEKIPLTPSWMGSYAVAFGLKADSHSPQILLFKGTSYPTDEGFIKQLLADVSPASSVGSLLFFFGKKKLQEWFKEHRSLVYGASLGGALAQHAANHFPEKVIKVFAYNPPALLNYEIISNKGPQVNVISNIGDIVTRSGSKRAAHCNLYQIIPLHPRNFLLAHVQCYEAYAKHLILLKKVKERGFFDYFITWGHLILSVPLFILGTLISLILLPFIRKKR